MTSQEIQIPVPWGIIAAKTWGNSKDPLMLAIHGWVDNANSFDPLIPLLPQCFYYVCIDLPGHGKSSAVQSSLILRDLDYIIPIKLVYDYFKRKKISIMAHSLGGFLTLLFTQMYPRCVSKIVIFDIIYLYPRPVAEQFRRLIWFNGQRLKFLAKESESPTYSKEEVFNKIMTKRVTPVSRKAAEILIERSIEPAPDGKYYIRVAQNVKHMILTQITIDDSLEILKRYPIKCPHMTILSSSSSAMQIAFRRVLNVFKQNPNYEFHTVEGTHEVHLENPEPVAKLLSIFLLKHQNKL